MVGDVIVFFAIYLISLSVLYFPGRFLLSLLKNTIQVKAYYTQVFLSLLLGIITCVFIFASIKSSSLSCNIFLPLILLLTFYRNKISISVPQKTSTETKKSGLYLYHALLVTIPFIYFATLIFKSGDFHFNAMDYDNVLYSGLSDYISKTGTENKWFMYFSDVSLVKGVEPYHYSESWLNAFITAIFGKNSMQSFYLVTYPLLILVSLFGLLALIEHFKTPGPIEFFLVICLLFIGPIYQIKEMDYYHNKMACEIPFQRYGEKFAIYYPFILFSILLIINGYFKEACLFLLCLCVLSSTVLPALLLFFIVLVIVSSSNRMYFFYRGTLFFVLFILFYQLFSFKENSSSNASAMFAYSDFSSEYFTFTRLKLGLSNYFHSFTTHLFNFTLNYFYILPLIFYVAFIKKDKYIRQLSTLLIPCFFGLLIACFFYKHPDSHQLFTNTLPLLHLFTITLFILLFYRSSKTKKLVIGSFVALFFLNTIYCSWKEYRVLSEQSSVSDDYLLQLKTILAKEHSPQKVGFLSTKEDYVHYFLQRNSNSLYHLTYLGIDPIPINMSCAEIENIADTLVYSQDYPRIIEHDLFYQFYQKNQVANKNIDSVKRAFIKQEGLNYLLLTPACSMPGFINSTNSTVFMDSKSKLRFVRLYNL